MLPPCLGKDKTLASSRKCLGFVTAKAAMAHRHTDQHGLPAIPPPCLPNLVEEVVGLRRLMHCEARPFAAAKPASARQREMPDFCQDSSSASSGRDLVHLENCGRAMPFEEPAQRSCVQLHCALYRSDLFPFAPCMDMHGLTLTSTNTTTNTNTNTTPTRTHAQTQAQTNKQAHKKNTNTHAHTHETHKHKHLTEQEHGNSKHKKNNATQGPCLLTRPFFS
jgi:hypothetical protein